MKVGNFGSFDENLKAKNISGLKNASKLDRQIWTNLTEIGARYTMRAKI